MSARVVMVRLTEAQYEALVSAVVERTEVLSDRNDVREAMTLDNAVQALSFAWVHRSIKA